MFEIILFPGTGVEYLPLVVSIIDRESVDTPSCDSISFSGPKKPIASNTISTG